MPIFRKKISIDPGTIMMVRRLLVEVGSRHWKGYAKSIVLMGIAAVCTGLSAYFMGTIINQAYVYKSFEGLIVVCLAAVVIFTVKGLANYGQIVTMAGVGNRIVAENQRALFDKVLQQNIGYFSDRHSSEFLARVALMASAPSTVLSLVITSFGRDVLSLVSLVAVMILQDPLMSLFGLVVLPPAVISVRKLIKRARHITLTQFGSSVRILESLQDTVQGMGTVKAFGLEEQMRSRVHQSVADVERASNKLIRVSNRAGPLMESLGGIAIALAFMYGGYSVIISGSAPGAFVSFIAAFLLAYEPAKRIARLNIDLSNSLVGVKILNEMLDSPPSEPDDSHLPALEVKAGHIEVDNVEFSYRPGEPVLKGMSMTAMPGSVTALVGRSGGGKTTLLNLILRLYQIDRGAIRIDGQEISSVRRVSVRRQVAYVGQDIFLFRGSIRQNILVGKPDATDEELIAAAKAAYAHDFIQTFPAGYDTPVGELGVQLSGGQRQRIAVARALIRNAPIILLDEPTASLDSESERYVQDAIHKLCEGRTTLVIAHRLHTITNADCIYVIEDGVAVEFGRHDALMRKEGRYASYFKTQFKLVS